MIIVAGKLYVAAAERQSYLDGCREVIELARQTPGCVDFHLSTIRWSRTGSTSTSSGRASPTSKRFADPAFGGAGNRHPRRRGLPA